MTDVITVAAGKWTVEIMRELCLGPTRTRRFLAHIPGLTMKSLRQRLQQLEQLELVHRQDFNEKPLRVEYSITPKGRRFVDLLNLAKEISDEWAGGVRCVCPCSNVHFLCTESPTCQFRREARAKLSKY